VSPIDCLLFRFQSEDSKEATILEKLQEMVPRTGDDKIASIVFHGVFGENFQTEDAPSWFNPNEAAQVFYYVNELYRLGLTESDIGIITPYKAQVLLHRCRCM
jgi:RNA helicase armi